MLTERPDVCIVNYDAVTYAGNPANLRDVEANPRYRFVKGNICDAEAVSRTVFTDVDTIVNFAAESHVDRSIRDPQAFLRTNVIGTDVLLEAARRKRVRRFLHVSTDEVYGEVVSGHSKESDAVAPRSPYSVSKAAADLHVLAYGTTYGLPVVVTRGSNTYGPYQHPEKFIPLFVTNLLDGENVPLYGDGLHVRDWIHVEDHAAAILHVLEHGEERSVYNVGGGNLRTNRQIVERLLDLCGGDYETHVRHVADREGHDRRYAVDCSKVRALGWTPHYEFETALRATVQWYRDNQSWWRPTKEGIFADYYELQYAGRWRR